jgi:hypothetical protein
MRMSVFLYPMNGSADSHSRDGARPLSRVPSMLVQFDADRIAPTAFADARTASADCTHFW